MASTRLFQWVQASALIFAFTLGLFSSARAQIVLMSPVGESYDWQYDVEVESDYQTQAQIDGGGAFDALRVKATGHIRGPLSHTTRLYLDVSYAHTRYDFSQDEAGSCSIPSACFANSPWQDVHTLDVAPGGSLILSEALRIQAFVPIRWHAESDSDRGGVTAGLLAQLEIRFSDTFITSLGVGVQSEIEQDASVFPVISLDWQINDRYRLLTRGDPYQGGDMALLLAHNQRLQGSVSIGYERRRFRLSASSPDSNGVGEMTSIPLLVGISIGFGQDSELSFEGGIAVRGRLELDDAHGNELRYESFDTAGLIRGLLRLAF